VHKIGDNKYAIYSRRLEDHTPKFPDLIASLPQVRSLLCACSSFVGYVRVLTERDVLADRQCEKEGTQTYILGKRSPSLLSKLAPNSRCTRTTAHQQTARSWRTIGTARRYCRSKL
jgi:hypothetical protein